MLDKTDDVISEQELTDPVCGMSVTRFSKYHFHYEDKEYYFCSDNCSDNFRTNPAKYLKPSSETRATHSGESGNHNNATYTCPMHPEVVQDHPGSCPKCGMALELNPSFQAPIQAIFTCPMHPEVIRKEPGDCPICGMDLIPLASMDAGGEDVDPNEIMMTESAAKLAAIQTMIILMEILFVINHLCRSGTTRFETAAVRV